jgi:hypothetical protein
MMRRCQWKASRNIVVAATLSTRALKVAGKYFNRFLHQ